MAGQQHMQGRGETQRRGCGHIMHLPVCHHNHPGETLGRQIFQPLTQAFEQECAVILMAVISDHPRIQIRERGKLCGEGFGRRRQLRGPLIQSLAAGLVQHQRNNIPDRHMLFKIQHRIGQRSRKKRHTQPAPGPCAAPCPQGTGHQPQGQNHQPAKQRIRQKGQDMQMNHRPSSATVREAPSYAPDRLYKSP